MTAATTYPLTLIWPASLTDLATIQDQWRRLPDGRIEATYNDREELATCLTIVGQRPAADVSDPDNQDGGEGAGWYEDKFINGYGPYRYRRWRQDGKLKSEYLGKVQELGSTSQPSGVAP